MRRWRIVKDPISNEEAGRIVRENGAMGDAVNAKLAEQEKVYGPGT